jgi:transposase
VQKSENWLSDYFSRIRAKGGHKCVIVATANKIATIFYKMVSNKEVFKVVELRDYQEKYKQAKIAYLEHKLNELKQRVA